jgi:single-stranded DNA-binding protein
MMTALIAGDLSAEPAERTASNGNRYWTASARVATGGEPVFVSIATFDPQAGERLMQLHKGSSIAAVGTLEATTWTDKAGAERKGWRLLTHEILSVYQARKRRDTGEGVTQ